MVTLKRTMITFTVVLLGTSVNGLGQLRIRESEVITGSRSGRPSEPRPADPPDHPSVPMSGENIGTSAEQPQKKETVSHKAEAPKAQAQKTQVSKPEESKSEAQRNEVPRAERITPHAADEHPEHQFGHATAPPTMAPTAAHTTASTGQHVATTEPSTANNNIGQKVAAVKAALIALQKVWGTPRPRYKMARPEESENTELQDALTEGLKIIFDPNLKNVLHAWMKVLAPSKGGTSQDLITREGPYPEELALWSAMKDLEDSRHGRTDEELRRRINEEVEKLKKSQGPEIRSK